MTVTDATDPASDAPRLVIVDDDVELGRALQEFLVAAGFRVWRMEDVPSGRRAIAQARPDLCIVDIMMPGTSGKVLCGELAEGSDAGVIMMSSISDNETVVALLGIGADDYIIKPFQFAEMLARINAVLRRRQRHAGPTATKQTTRIGAWTFDPAERRLRDDTGRTVALTPSEIGLLRFLCASPGIEEGSFVCDSSNMRSAISSADDQRPSPS